MTAPPISIAGVLERLDAIVEDARRRRSRIGYFAALYRGVTRDVRRGIDSGLFEDGARMERLDVRFANRYLDALDAYQAGRRPSAPWEVAFRSAERWPPLILQHLLLGINAHIHLDLGIAAAQTAPGPALAALERDFLLINDLLEARIDAVQDGISSISPWMRVLDRAGDRCDEILGGFCIRSSRSYAWDVGHRLAALPPDQQDAEIRSMEECVARLARVVTFRGFLTRPLWLCVRLREARQVERIIDALGAV